MAPGDEKEPSIEERLRSFIIKNFLFGKLTPPFTDQASFLEMGIIDSTGVIELVTYVQDAFGISVQNEELVPENLDSIQKLVSFIERKRAAARQ